MFQDSPAIVRLVIGFWPIWAGLLAGPFLLQIVLNHPFDRFRAVVLTACWWALWVLPLMGIAAYTKVYAPLYHARLVSFITAQGSIVALVVSVSTTLIVLLMTYFMLRRGIGFDALSSYLWLKYVRRRRIMLLSVVAVAISVSLLIAVASLFTGFIAAFERSAVEAIGDIAMRAPEGIRFEKHPEFIRRLEQSDLVEAATASLTTEGLLRLEGGNVRPVVIWGIEPGSRTRVVGLKEALICQRKAAGEPSFAVPNAPGETGGFVGIAVLSKPDEQTDQYDQEAVCREMLNKRVVLMAGTMELGAKGERIARRSTIPFRIVDITFTGAYPIDSSFVYVPLDVLQKELYPHEKGPVATSINIKLKPGVDPDRAVGQIHELWQTFAAQELNWSPMAISLTAIRTSRQMQRVYIAEFEKQKHVLEVTFSVISFSVVVLVFCIFHMMVKLKQQDIAIVKSCGAANSSVIGLFLGFGVSIGIAGSGLGAALGYAITRNINEIEGWIRVLFGLKLWRSSVYMFDRIPNQVDWNSALLFATLAMAAAAVGALLPAVAAARTRPVEVLRHE